MSTDHHTRLILWPEPEVKTPVVDDGDLYICRKAAAVLHMEDELKTADHTTREWELARALHIRSAQPCDRVTDGREDFYRRLAEHQNNTTKETGT